MDMFSIHVYGESPKIPPSLAIPGRRRSGSPTTTSSSRCSGEAFDGTAQNGSKLPIVYGEYGVETTVPADEQSAYTGQEVVKTVDDATQAQYYAQAISLAACQRNVRMLLLFHVLDERRLQGLQSGLYYADGTPKPSLDKVRRRDRPSVLPKLDAATKVEPMSEPVVAPADRHLGQGVPASGRRGGHRRAPVDSRSRRRRPQAHRVPIRARVSAGVARGVGAHRPGSAAGRLGLVQGRARHPRHAGPVRPLPHAGARWRTRSRSEPTSR